MDERFDKFIDVIFAHEGGYVNDPDDFGGETRYGITKRRYSDLDIKNLSKEKAKDIYYADFYLNMNLHFIKNDLLALHLLDMGVNAGIKIAVKLFQELLRNCDSDGVIGPITGELTTDADIYVDLVEAYIGKRIEYYYKVSKRGNNIKYLNGWINRIYNTKL